MVAGNTYDQLFGPLNVLVVDDMAAIRRMLRQMLQHLGVQGDIKEAGDGLEAWEALQGCSFDLVVCDINMPRMNGLDLLRRLRATDQYRTTPFLMISGEVAEDIIAASAESEVDGYLLKPFKVESLESRLRDIISHRHHPSPRECLFRKASRLLAAGQPAAALEVLEQLNQPPSRAQAKVLNLMGECHLSLGGTEAAAACFEQALDLNPKYFKAYHHLAALMESRGNLAAARSYLEEARRLSPLNPERLYNLGQLCLQTGSPEEAKQYLEDSWRLGPYAPADHRSEMAETFLAAGLEQIAVDLLLQAIDQAPQEVHHYHLLGAAFQRQQKYRQALECYQQALELEPDNESTYFYLGILYFEWGGKEKALQAFQVALKLRPDFAEAKDFLQRHFST